MAQPRKTPVPPAGSPPSRGALIATALLVLVGIAVNVLLNRPRPSEAVEAPDRPYHENGLVRTPPMGWNSWNRFGCGVSDGLIRAMADALVESGMKDAGYEFIVVDDCWMSEKRVRGHLQPDPANFPYGMRNLADYIHAKGLKFGLYLDRGRKTCQGRAGSLGHEKRDAADLAAWGVDYVKVDNCHLPWFDDPQRGFHRMKRALMNSGWPVVFSLCMWGFEDWMPQQANLWRTTGDINDNWDSMLANAEENVKYADYAGPGRWNDPDMLEIGNGGMTDDEYRAHMSLWAVMAAPLMAGNDLRNMTPSTKEILMNREVIAVDQDPMGVQGRKVWEGGDGYRIYSRPLAGENVRAVVLLNGSSQAATLKAEWKDLSLLPGRARVRDLWAHADRGVFQDSYSTRVPPHGAVMVKVTRLPVR